MRREELKLVLDTGILMLILKGDPKVAGIVRKVFESAKACTITADKRLENIEEINVKTYEIKT